MTNPSHLPPNQRPGSPNNPPSDPKLISREVYSGAMIITALAPSILDKMSNFIAGSPPSKKINFTSGDQFKEETGRVFPIFRTTFPGKNRT